ncbi:hypothetical protein EGW08_006001 [Elysia chlorotica]|uniref:Uncharacterized protein n=1 Tax=Elysia chlorotica TaxID=188477 RepID=A0A3S0ZYL3_ELYCH|nr:hypothetical protein EGW08_006001 [Elysia chlorotica]
MFWAGEKLEKLFRAHHYYTDTETTKTYIATTKPHSYSTVGWGHSLNHSLQHFLKHCVSLLWHQVTLVNRSMANTPALELGTTEMLIIHINICIYPRFPEPSPSLMGSATQHTCLGLVASPLTPKTATMRAHVKNISHHNNITHSSQPSVSMTVCYVHNWVNKTHESCCLLQI